MDDIKDGDDYNKEYYEKNKKVIAKKRKLRYRSDPEYRKQMARASVKFRSEKQRELNGRVEREINGVVHLVYKVGRVVEMLGVNNDTVRRWEEAGLLPQAVFGKSRCYNKNQIYLMNLIKEAMAKYKSSKKAKQAVGRIVNSNWMEGL